MAIIVSIDCSLLSNIKIISFEVLISFPRHMYQTMVHYNQCIKMIINKPSDSVLTYATIPIDWVSNKRKKDSESSRGGTNVGDRRGRRQRRAASRRCWTPRSWGWCWRRCAVTASAPSRYAPCRWWPLRRSCPTVRRCGTTTRWPPADLPPVTIDSLHSIAKMIYSHCLRDRYSMT